jgi:fructokinase
VSEHALVIGEALVDVVIHPDAAPSSHPGGSPANVAIGLARLGRDAELLTWFGDDALGATVRQHLEGDHVAVVPGSQTAPATSVATAHVDAEGVATYDFDLTWEVPAGSQPRPHPLVVHAGSIAAVIEPGASSVYQHLVHSREHSTVTYDPNARPALMGTPAAARAVIERCVAASDVVKVSDEDLGWLAPDASAADIARSWATAGPAIVVVTAGGSGATAYMSSGAEVTVLAPRVDVADTVGAGDSFMAGLIDGLWSADMLGAHQRAHLHGISPETVSGILERCARIAAITVSRPGANPPRSAELGES